VKKTKGQRNAWPNQTSSKGRRLKKEGRGYKSLEKGETGKRGNRESMLKNCEQAKKKNAPPEKKAAGFLFRLSS